MKRLILSLLVLITVVGSTKAPAQSLLDDFNRAQTTGLDGSRLWRKLLNLTDPSASMQINADSTISPYHPLGALNRGGVYWNSALTGGRFQIGIVLKHKSGSDNLPVFHIQLMNDSSWFTGNGYGLRFQENAGTDRYDIQRITGSGTDTPYVSLLATLNQELSAGDTLFFKFYEDGRKSAVRYGHDGSRDSITVVDTTYRPAAWYPWIQGKVFPDPFKLDDFMAGPIPYRISASAGAGGAISPAGNVLVNPGGSGSFTFIPDQGFGIADVLVDSASVGTPSSYEFTGIGRDHSIRVLFDTLRYAVTASAGPHGSITPTGPITVAYGGSASFAISPEAGYHLDSLVVDGSPVDSTTSYTFTNVTAPHSIAGYFSINVYMIAASAGAHGTITPSGAVTVPWGSVRAFSIVPSAGCHLDSLVVDGNKTDSTVGYTFYAVSGNHSIAAWFSLNVYAITATAGPNGSITPSGSVPAAHGSNRSFTITRDPGFYVDTVTVDGVRVDSVTGYTFYNVTGPHTIHATFVNHIDATRTYRVDDKWNLVSAALRTADLSRATLFPRSSGSAYAYSEGYTASDTLNVGRGYWLKFPAEDSTTITGYLILAETVDVAEGWNIVGSISAPVPVSGVLTIPPGLSGSNFYGYNGSYTVSQVFEPGHAYWVKMEGPGKLVLSDGTPPNHPSAMRIAGSAELPPPPPGAPTAGGPAGIPTRYGIGQNYPNPFNPSTKIEYTLPEAGYVRLTVYNVLGEEVARLADGVESAGRKSVYFDAAGLPAGFYTARLEAGPYTGQRKMLLLK